MEVSEQGEGRELKKYTSGPGFERENVQLKTRGRQSTRQQHPGPACSCFWWTMHGTREAAKKSKDLNRRRIETENRGKKRHEGRRKVVPIREPGGTIFE